MANRHGHSGNSTVIINVRLLRNLAFAENRSLGDPHELQVPKIIAALHRHRDARHDHLGRTGQATRSKQNNSGSN